MPRVSIVTGGASGIGFALGRALVSRGVRVVLADIDGGAAARAADALTGGGAGAVEAAVVDVTDAAAVDDLVTTTRQEHGRLDFLFNNAGIGVGGEPEELSLAHWQQAIDVNVRGVVHGCHAAYPVMLRQGFGHIVNTASLAGLGPGTGQLAPYVMTKHAVIGLSLALRMAGADGGVRVSVVCPGLVDTPIVDKKQVAGLPVPPSVAAVDMRRFFRDAGFRTPYPAERLAEDVLRGVARNRAVIVSPRQARVPWLLWRFVPRVALAAGLKGTRQWREQTRVGPSSSS